MDRSTPSQIRRILQIAALTAGSAVLASQAFAAPLPPFTFNPGGVGLNGTTVTADNLVLSDFSTVTLSPTGTGANFTDNGVLAVVGYQNGGSPNGTSGLNSTYGLYFQFAGTGTQNTPDFRLGTTGTFNTLSYQLYGYNLTPGQTVTYNPANAVPGGVTSPTLLGAGSLIGGNVTANSATIPTATGTAIIGVPGASTLLSFAPSPTALPFFQSPDPFYNADFATFINTPSEVTPTADGFVITQGGGTANFLSIASTPVPEPVSLSMLGAGLLFAGLARSRRRAP